MPSFTLVSVVEVYSRNTVDDIASEVVVQLWFYSGLSNGFPRPVLRTGTGFIVQGTTDSIGH